MSFVDKVILITGGNSGIGADCAGYFAKEGAKLALVGRSVEKFETVIEQIKESGVEIEPLVILADVSTDAERIIAETIEKYERIDVLINNAGFAIFDSLDTMNMEDYDGKLIHIITDVYLVAYSDIFCVNIHSYDSDKCARSRYFFF